MLTACFAAGCGYRLPGAMGPTQSPDEIRRQEGEMAMYRLDKERKPAPPKTVASAPAPKAAASASPASRTPQAANPPARGRNESKPTPAAMRYGDLFFISGQLPTDVRGNPTAESRVEEQARLAMENVRAVLEANQMTMANVISTTVYLRDLNDTAAFDRIYATYFNGALPSRSIVEVARLPDNARVSISAVAGR
jgi:2-iminobutanoate/2-iminopropanoate deaminase